MAESEVRFCCSSSAEQKAVEGGGPRSLNVSQHTGRQVLGFQIGSGQVKVLGFLDQRILSFS
jgi:hypothetical protein